jgi:hypothetical protein
MPTKSFSVTHYKTCVGFKNSATWSGVNIQIQGYITCYSADNYRLIMYFLHPDSPVPPPVYIPANKVGAIFLPFSDMPIYLDIVRNEKPIYAYLNTDKPEWNSIKTANEPVGEEES